jgi:hypothetical protein
VLVALLLGLVRVGHRRHRGRGVVNRSSR